MKENEVLSLVVPVFNEQSRLAQVIEALLNSPCPIRREWIFVDDSSTDGSPAILRDLQVKHGFKLFFLEKNSGKGSAVRKGINEATGDYIMIQDADFEYDPQDIPQLLEPLLKGRADIVYGSRFKKSAPQVHRTYHYFINRFLTILSNLFSGIYLTDMETCYKIFRSDILKNMNLTSSRFGIEVELTAYIGKIRAQIFELPINYYPRTKLQGKKINWKDGLAALYHLLRFNFFVKFEDAYKPDLPEHYHVKYDSPERSSSGILNR